MSIWVKCMYVGGVWMRLSMYRSAQAFYGTANALDLKIFVRQNSTHLTVLKHQNTKTSLYKLSKNHWVDVLFEILGPSEKNYNLLSLMITLYNRYCCCSIVYDAKNTRKVSTTFSVNCHRGKRYFTEPKFVHSGRESSHIASKTWMYVKPRW